MQNDDDALDLRVIIGSMLDIVSYAPLNNPRIEKSCTDALEQAIGDEVKSWNVNDGHDGALFASIVKKAVYLIQVCVPPVS
jgi:hypothetical protein